MGEVIKLQAVPPKRVVVDSPWWSSILSLRVLVGGLIRRFLLEVYQIGDVSLCRNSYPMQIAI
jgi:hypothetical protein